MSAKQFHSFEIFFTDYSVIVTETNIVDAIVGAAKRHQRDTTEVVCAENVLIRRPASDSDLSTSNTKHTH